MYNFIEVLSEPVKVGQKFVISGTSSAEAENVSILLSSGTDSNAEAALSIDLNFSSNKVVVSKNAENDVALSRGDKFEFIIRIDTDSFEISYNGESLNAFKSQISPDKIQSVIIHGDVDKLLKVNHLDAEYPNIVASDDELALESYIPGKYKAGHVIAIAGKCTDEFYLMFTKNDTNRQLIHLNVRFDEETVVMNTEDDEDCWSENEDRSAEFPFVLESPFKLAFAFTEEALKVAVNGSSLMEFNYDRISLEEDESLWEVLSGFRIKNRNEENAITINEVKHIQMGGSSCDGFEQHSAL